MSRVAPLPGASPLPGDAAGPHPPDRPRPSARPSRRGAPPWPAWAAAVAVVGATVVVLTQLHPSLLLSNTTTDGGDTGAHVMMPAFLAHLLAHGKLSGWDPAWYDGFPGYTFYFPFPGLVAVVLHTVLSYDISFKLVTALGSLTLPVAAYLFGRLAGLRDPGPGCLAAATLPFLFEPSFTIDGGNLLSTLAGEYAFSLGLSLALVTLGLVAAGLRTGRHRALTALFLAATVLSHLVTAFFVIVGTVVWLLLDGDLLATLRAALDRGATPLRRAARSRWVRRFWWCAVVGVVGMGLTAWWLLPFAADLSYTTNMGWVNVGNFPHLLFPVSDRWLQASAAVGLVATVSRRNRVGWFVAVMGGLSAAAVILDPQGKLYNVRFLPLWFLCLDLLAGIAVAEVVSAAARWLRRLRYERWSDAVRDRLAVPAPRASGWRPGMRITRFRRPTPPPWPAGALAGPLVALAAACLVVVPPMVLPASTLAKVGINVGPDQPSAWATWNYTGYQGKPAYPEYRAVVGLMAHVGATDGCGRAMWEYSPDLNQFGTTMSLMLLPYWTHGCIDSMEGLLFESSATTPYHFINQSELSAVPSDAMVGLPYGGLDVPLGVQHLQMLGVRYFLASSPSVEQQAAADPALTLVGQTGPWRTTYDGQALDIVWKVYRVARSPLVQPLANRPVVWTVGQSQSRWLHPSMAWYLDPARWDVVPAAGGPASWTRVPTGDRHPPVVPEPSTTVADVRQTNSTVSFRVSRVGVPVEVKVSYFPNWKAEGAQGPWRVAPNLMVVVPTSHAVTLRYGTTAAESSGEALSGAAVVATAVLALLGWRRRRLLHRTLTAS